MGIRDWLFSRSEEAKPLTDAQYLWTIEHARKSAATVASFAAMGAEGSGPRMMRTLNACHPERGLAASYLDGLLFIRCNKCKRHLDVIKVAET